jgi:hypothetical protein
MQKGWHRDDGGKSNALSRQIVSACGQIRAKRFGVRGVPAALSLLGDGAAMT